MTPGDRTTSDARLDRLHAALAARAPLRLARAATHQEAAVALVLRPRADLELLLIRRAVHERDPWSGHMALPGGRRDARDEHLFATACRETSEETALELAASGRLLGGLDEVAPGSARLPPVVIAPFVTAVPADAEARPNSPEVDAVLWVPLAALRDDSAVSELLIELAEGTQAFPSLNYQGHVIWGLTHRILIQLLELTEEAGL